MGSGHILVYAFEVFLQLYEAEGESTRTAVEIILEKNLFGLDIDKRAFQLSYFALMMKGRQYNRRFLTKKLQSNVYQIPDNFGISESELQLVHFDFPNQEKGQVDLTLILDAFKMSPDLGSLISFEGIDFENLNAGMRKQDVSFFDEELKQIIQVAELLQIKYTIAITNPPYMGSSGMNKELATFVKKQYPASKSDLFAVFMERIKDLLEPLGYYAMITQHAWMFLSSFEKLRLKINQQTIINMAHLGTRAFEEIGGEVVQTTAFVMSPIKHSAYIGSYLRLVDFLNHEEKKQKAYEAIHSGKSECLYSTLQDNFTKIPGIPISYWVSEKLIHSFTTGKSMGSLGEIRSGIMVNSKFILDWPEVNRINVKFDCKNVKEMRGFKWFPLNSGGGKMKWYGNNYSIINLEDSGEAIKKSGTNYRLRDTKYYFKPGITWGRITSSTITFRKSPQGNLFGDAGPMMFIENYHNQLLALSNSKVMLYFADIFNPTLNFQVDDMKNFPVIFDYENEVDVLVSTLLQHTKINWDSKETSWDFSQHPLI